VLGARSHYQPVPQSKMELTQISWSQMSEAVATTDTRRQAALVAMAVATAHGVNDAYSAFLHPLLPGSWTGWACRWRWRQRWR
jgi:hypothetical protein